MSIAENIARIRAEMTEAAIGAGREPSGIQLCAATGKPSAGALTAAAKTGCRS